MGAHVTSDPSWSCRKEDKQSVTGSWTCCPSLPCPPREVRPDERQACHSLCPTRPATTEASSAGTSRCPHWLTGHGGPPRQARRWESSHTPTYPSKPYFQGSFLPAALLRAPSDLAWTTQAVESESSSCSSSNPKSWGGGTHCQAAPVGDISLHFHLRPWASVSHFVQRAERDTAACWGLGMGCLSIALVTREWGEMEQDEALPRNPTWPTGPSNEGSSRLEVGTGSKPLLGSMDWTTVHWAVPLPGSLPP